MNQYLTFDFDGDTLLAIKSPDAAYIAVKPISDALGLDWSAQYRRLQRDAILGEGIAVMAMPSGGGLQETICLPLDLIHGWLFTIDDARVRDQSVRDRVLMYKRECYRVLSEHFSGRATARRAEPESCSQDDLHGRFLLSRPLPPMLTRSRSNRIRHYRAMHDQAIAALISLGDEIGGSFLDLDPEGDL